MDTKLFGSLESCIRAGDTYQLPSSRTKKIRSGFHVARFDMLMDFIQKQTFPDRDELQRHSTLTFNVIFDQLMKAAQKSEAIATSSQAKPVVGSLDDREKNVVRYTGRIHCN